MNGQADKWKSLFCGPQMVSGLCHGETNHWSIRKSYRLNGFICGVNIYSHLMQLCSLQKVAADWPRQCSAFSPPAFLCHALERWLLYNNGKSLWESLTVFSHISNIFLRSGIMEKPLQGRKKSPWPVATVQLRAPLSVMGWNSIWGLSGDGSAGSNTNPLTLWRLTLALVCSSTPN